MVIVEFIIIIAITKSFFVLSRLHPEAYKYLLNFSKHKQELAERLYALFNHEVFLDELPHDMEIFWSSRLVKTAGRCHSKKKSGNYQLWRCTFLLLDFLLFEHLGVQ